MRDFIGRVIHRQPEQRARFIESSGEPLLLALAEAITDEPIDFSPMDHDFVEQYLAGMGRRASKWKMDDVEDVSRYEIDRALGAFSRFGPCQRAWFEEIPEPTR